MFFCGENFLKKDAGFLGGLLEKSPQTTSTLSLKKEELPSEGTAIKAVPFFVRCGESFSRVPIIGQYHCLSTRSLLDFLRNLRTPGVQRLALGCRCGRMLERDAVFGGTFGKVFFVDPF